MTDHRDKIIEAMANDEALVTLISDTAVVSRATAQGLISALRAAGHLPPPGALVIPPLETKEGRDALVRAIDAYEAALDDDLCAMEEALRAAGER